MIVLDASAATDVLLERGPEGEWASAIVAEADWAHAPHLIDNEVASALRTLVLAREISASRGRIALHRYRELRLVRYPSTRLLGRVWELRRSLTAYDAAYVALAEALGLPLVTTDARLGRSRGHRASIAFPGS